MNDSRKTKAQLISELEALRGRVATLEKASGVEEKDAPAGREFVAAGTEVTGQADRKGGGEGKDILFEWILENIPLGLTVVDKDLNIVAHNAHHLKMYELPKQFWAIGTSLVDIFRYNAERGEYGPGDVEEQVRERVALAKKFQPHQFERRRPDGTVLEITGSPLPGGGFISVTADVTERKQAEEELRASQRLLQTVFDTIPQWVFVKDRQSRYVMVNNALLESYGLKDEEFRGARYREIDENLVEEEVRMFEETDRRVMELGERQDVPEHTVSLPNGETHIRHLIKLPLRDEGGEIVGVVGVSENITERKQAEEGLRNSERRFRTVAQAAPVPVLITRKSDSRILYANESFKDVFAVKGDPAGRESTAFYWDPADRERLLQNLGESGRYYESVRAFKKDNGEKFWGIVSNLEMDFEGEEALLVSVVDVTERRRAEEELRKSERNLAEAQRIARLGSWERDIATGASKWSEELYGIYGLQPQEFTPSHESFIELVHPDDRDKVRQAARDAIEDNIPLDMEYRIVRPDGNEKAIQARANVIREEDGTPLRIVGTALDITERKQAEEELRKSEEEFRLLVETTHAINWVMDLTTMKFTYVDPQAERITGYAPEEWVDFEFWAGIIHPEDRDWAVRFCKAATARSEAHDFEYRIVAKDGRVVWLHDMVTVESGPQGPTTLRGFQIDITERKQAEEALRESEERMRLLTNAVPVLITYIDAGQRFRFSNATQTRWLSKSGEELYGKRVDEFLSPAAYEVVRPYIDRALAGEQVRFEAVLPYPDGKTRTVHIVYIPDIGPAGEVRGYSSMAEDITERKRSEEDLRSSQELLQTVMDTVPHVVFVKDREGRFNLVNRAFRELYGLDADEAIGKGTMDLSLGTQTEKDGHVEQDERLWKTGEPVVEPELKVTDKVGNLTIRNSIKLPLFDQQGTITGLVCISEDITERRQLEEQLRQSQKLEAVGQLAGGVAHEFNNLLQIIFGAVGLSLISTPEEDDRHRHLQTVKRASERGAGLVRQLLGFSRRQALRPEILDLNELIPSLMGMLRSTIGEQIEMAFIPHAGLKNIHADPATIEQVLINLCLNARDAMPDGGLLKLETEPAILDEGFCVENPWAKAGEFVKISVSDSGVGIAPEVAERVFEPFFTTKGPQLGTGLGLSLVYGLIEQHGGLINFSSLPEAGTVFYVYLPVADEQGAAPAMAAAAPSPVAGAAPAAARDGGEMAAPAGGRGTILVAEDEPELQALTAQILERAGYRVLSAKDGAEAMEMFESHAETIDVVLLDLVMPGKSGKDVFDRIKRLRPAVPVLFQSGYNVGGRDIEFIARQKLKILQKPYPSTELVRAVNDAMAAAGS